MEKRFAINYTTDLHGYLFPTDYLDRQEKQIGLLKLAAAFRKDGNTLTMDGGDMLQGSLFATLTRKMHPDSTALAEAMNMAGYQAVVVGNHDFNFGIPFLKQYLTALHAVCLCCNVRDKKGELPLRPYAVFPLENGLNIGVIGAVTHHITKWEPKETLDQLIIEPPLEPIRRALDEVRPLCDLTVLIYHGGFERDVDTGESVSESDENQGWLFAETLGVDLLLTGHQHQRIAGKTVCGTPVVQAGCNAACFARIEGEKKDGQKPHIESRLLSPAVAAKADMLRALQPLEAEVQKAADASLSALSCPLPCEPPLVRAINGSLIANFINQVQLAVSGAEISATAVAAENLSVPGRLSVRNVLTMYPFANTLTVLSMTGAMLKQYMESTLAYFDVYPKDQAGRPIDGSPVMETGRSVIGVSARFMKPKLANYNYDYFSGVLYTADLRLPPGRRVTKALIGGQPLDPGRRYTVCVNSYRAGGSGGYEFLREARIEQELQRDVAELILSYLSKRPSVQVDEARYLSVILP